MSAVMFIINTSPIYSDVISVDKAGLYDFQADLDKETPEDWTLAAFHMTKKSLCRFGSILIKHTNRQLQQ